MINRAVNPLPIVALTLLMMTAGLASAALADGYDRQGMLTNLRPAIVFGLTTLALLVSFWIARFRGDLMLFNGVLPLLGLGVLTLYRLQPALTSYRGFTADLADRHLLYVTVSMLAIWAVAIFFPEPERIAHYRYLILSGGILLLVLTALLGTEVYGARIWIDIGPILVQPPEFVKLALVIFLASYLAEKSEVVSAGWQVGRVTLPPLPYLLPVAVVAGGCLFILAALNDLGTALLLFTILLAMLYAATSKLSYVALGVGLFLAVAALGYRFVDRLEIRVANWRDPWRDPFLAGYQQIQSDYAIANGGILGTGWGRGNPEYIPVVETDFVFSAIAEEAGLIGSLAVIVLYMLLAGRGLQVAANSSSDVHRLMAIGLTAAIGLQAVIILAGVLRLLPLTGITLPFVSAGGSSLFSNAIAVGLLLRISAASQQERAP
jgi:cell division protein FtsW (lipid II flippase)